MIHKKISGKNFPSLPGIYIFKNRDNNVIYVGKAKNLKNRITSYFHKNANLTDKIKLLVKNISIIEFIKVDTEFDALLLEARLIKKLLPKYNVIWKDDKHYLYLKITKEEFPRFLMARKMEENDGIYFGPFPSSSIVKEMYIFIRKIFPFCIQNRSMNKPCFYTHIGLCNPCPANIKKLKNKEYQSSRKLYLQNIKLIKRLLEGKYKKIVKNIEIVMNKYSNNQKYEQAEIEKNKIYKINYLISRRFNFEEYLKNPYFLVNKYLNELRDLYSVLKKYFSFSKKIRRIECYDISNISGKLAAGSMTTFIDGTPDKKFYRRFKIKTIDTPNDFEMLSEVLRRRLKHKKWPLPDLFVIDGGKPQLIALQKVFIDLKVDKPFIGISKRFEELVIPNKSAYQKIKLNAESPSLHLIQRVRDEAHRFAHSYHKHLQNKYLLKMN